jgi:hypothetical protein
VENFMSASKWTTLTAEEAAKHPMYGIRGAASLLRAVCAVIPALGLLESIGTLTGFANMPRGILPIDGALIVPYVVFFLWSGYNAILLEKKKPSFIPSFLTFLVLGPVLSLSIPFLWQALSGITPTSAESSLRVESVLAAWGLWALIWAPYVVSSKRLNVTLLHRVRSGERPRQSIGHPEVRSIHLIPRLRTSIQRIWFIAMICGAAVALGSYFLFGLDGRYYTLIEAILDHPYTAWGYKISFIVGCLFACTGLIGSFFYDATFGKLVRWVRHGE